MGSQFGAQLGTQLGTQLGAQFGSQLGRKSLKEIEELNQIRIEQGLEPYKVDNRVCLRCETTFKSWSKLNRICTSCKNKNEEYLEEAYQFDPEAKFQYDLTVSQILDRTQHKGLELEWNPNHSGKDED